ncbi:hypothetical protein [Lysobacter capsici]|uniref:hypothetical protein n=1 Tax=Lysobacter capsici TaxID=435897 RepID=UPI0012FD7D53|nr:hypothetical protein [Lysobacter capsici]
MNNTINTKKTDAFICFTCLKESTDPKICSNCGEKIEEITLENSFFLPPQKMIYSILLSSISESQIIQAIKFVENNFSQTFKYEKTNNRLKIESTDIALAKLAKQIESMKSISEPDAFSRFIEINNANNS